jgi:hypothetical protein
MNFDVLFGPTKGIPLAATTQRWRWLTSSAPDNTRVFQSMEAKDTWRERHLVGAPSNQPVLGDHR